MGALASNCPHGTSQGLTWQRYTEGLALLLGKAAYCVVAKTKNMKLLGVRHNGFTSKRLLYIELASRSLASNAEVFCSRREDVAPEKEQQGNFPDGVLEHVVGSCVQNSTMQVMGTA